MDSRLIPIEDLPALYRAILDTVAELERHGSRSEAAHVRADATQAYSRSWDEASRRRLGQILARARRSVDGFEHGRFAGTRRQGLPRR